MLPRPRPLGRAGGGVPFFGLAAAVPRRPAAAAAAADGLRLPGVGLTPDL